MDKVQKIREEVERMHNLLPVMDGDNISVNYADRICTTLETYIDSLQEEPVSDELEKVVEEIVDPTVLNAYGVKEIANRLRRTMIEPVSEELGDYINELSKQFPEVSFAKLSRIAVRVAKWQVEQIKKAMDLGEPPYLISVEQAYYRTLKLLEE